MRTVIKTCRQHQFGIYLKFGLAVERARLPGSSHPRLKTGFFGLSQMSILLAS